MFVSSWFIIEHPPNQSNSQAETKIALPIIPITFLDHRSMHCRKGWNNCSQELYGRDEWSLFHSSSYLFHHWSPSYQTLVRISIAVWSQGLLISIRRTVPVPTNLHHREMFTPNCVHILASFTNHLRRMLDPRRPNRKVSTDKAEKLLIRYEPALPGHPTHVLSCNYQVSL